MSFESVLHAIVADCPGALGAALMGSDGIPIAQVAAPGVREEADEITVLGVEFGRVLDEARKAADAAGAGATLEISVRTERFHVVLHTVDPETDLVLALAPHGSGGRAGDEAGRHELASLEQR